MKYRVQNTSTKTVFIESSSQWNNIVMRPNDINAVTEAALAQFNLSWPGYLTILETYIDGSAPVSVTVNIPTTGWQLVSLGRFCTHFTFITTLSTCMVSFSGWDVSLSQTAPPTIFQLPIIATGGQNDGQAFNIDMPMDSTKSFYIYGTGSGTVTIIGN